MRSISVLLADDHPIAIAGVRHSLSDHERYTIVGEATSSDELVQMIVSLKPKVVITDYNMPGTSSYGDGLRLISFIRRNFPHIILIVLTMVTSPSVASSLLRLGVRSVLVKTGGLEALGRSIDQAIMENISSIGDNDEKYVKRDILERLTRKEIEVLRELFNGYSVGHIARAQQRSVKTISAQKMSAMRKLGVETDHELIILLSAHGAFT